MIEITPFKQDSILKQTRSTLDSYLEDKYLYTPNDERTRSMIMDDIQIWYMSIIDLNRFNRDILYKKTITNDIYKIRYNKFAILMASSGMSREDQEASFFKFEDRYSPYK